MCNKKVCLLAKNKTFKKLFWVSLSLSGIYISRSRFNVRVKCSFSDLKRNCQSQCRSIFEFFCAIAQVLLRKNQYDTHLLNF
jgi:hypothetical protein